MNVNVKPAHLSSGSEWLRWENHDHLGTAMNDQFPVGSWDDYRHATRIQLAATVALGAR
jgi:hypothetical protein